jgi:hypothetical protein
MSGTSLRFLAKLYHAHLRRSGGMPIGVVVGRFEVSSTTLNRNLKPPIVVSRTSLRISFNSCSEEALMLRIDRMILRRRSPCRVRIVDENVELPQLGVRHIYQMQGFVIVGVVRSHPVGF